MKEGREGSLVPSLASGSSGLDEATMLSQDQCAKMKMLELVLRLHSIPIEKAGVALRDIVANLAALSLAARHVGYTYGMPPHRMGDPLRNEIVRVGIRMLVGVVNFEVPPYAELQGNTLHNVLEKFRGANFRPDDLGLDIFKTLVVDLGSPDFQEWQSYLVERTR